MKRVTAFAIFIFCAVVLSAPRAAAQSGSIEFVARATPASGVEEPVRGLPFFLLSKSFEEISHEASAAYPKSDMNAFIDGLSVSKELKEWMKKNHTITFAGDEFIKKLTVPDVMGVPEFYSAYMTRNAEGEAYDFPKPKMKPADKKNNPAKYDKLAAEYKETVRQYMTAHMDSIDGLETYLIDIDPTPKWNELESQRLPAIHRDALQLAQSKYLVARTETDLQGQGFLRGLAPGTYWLSNLDTPASVGETRLHWDTRVIVGPGNVAYITLTNGNAVQPRRSSS
jgi:hypothetical protein